MGAISSLSLSFFTKSAQAILKDTRRSTNLRRTIVAEDFDLLASMSNSNTSIGAALKGAGITFFEVMSCGSYHGKKGNPPLERSFNEDDFGSNFDSSAKEILGKAYFYAKSRSAGQATEDDIFLALVETKEEKKKPTAITIMERIVPDDKKKDILSTIFVKLRQNERKTQNTIPGNTPTVAAV